MAARTSRRPASELERYRRASHACGAVCGAATDVGRSRDRNEDAYWIAPDAAVLAVADGLGGLPHGELASALAVAAVERAHATMRPGGSWHEDGDALEEFARHAAEAAQADVVEAAGPAAAAQSMATTLVIAVVGAREAVVLHVGDSRAALVRGGRVVAKTVDHNGAGELLRSGLLSEEEARHHPSRHLVREVIGLAEGFTADCSRWPVEVGDVLLLMSDGVTEALDDDRIVRLVDATTAASAAASSLVSQAVLESGRDNATAIVRYVT